MNTNEGCLEAIDMDKMKTILLTRKYLITDDEHKIYAKIYEADKRITLKTESHQEEFRFLKSNSEMIESVANMMLVASKLVDKDINSLQKKNKIVKSK